MRRYQAKKGGEQDTVHESDIRGAKSSARSALTCATCGDIWDMDMDMDIWTWLMGCWSQDAGLTLTIIL